MRPTAIGSVSTKYSPSVLDVEREVGRPDLDVVAGTEAGGVDLAAVHLDAVGRSEVGDLPVARRVAAKLGVLARDVRVGQDAVALPRAAERRRPGRRGRSGGRRARRSPWSRSDARCASGAARLLLGLRRHLVDHRVALLALRRRLALALRGLDEPGLDSELAEAQALVDSRGSTSGRVRSARSWRRACSRR